jgi:mycofactocin precursor
MTQTIEIKPQTEAKEDTEELLTEELVVEEVSIDGMCGVY